MKKNNDEFVSSRKTPALKSIETYDHSNLFEHMFMEDYTTGFSYHFVNSNRDFYKTNPIDCELSILLEHERYNYLGYEFQNMIMRIFRHMLLRGKAYVEIEEIKEKDKLVGINFILISAKKRFEVGKNSFFVGVGQDDKKARFSVPKTNILKFNMKSLGLKENYYTSKRKKMKKLDIIGYTNLTLDPKIMVYSILVLFHRKLTNKKIKILKEILEKIIEALHLTIEMKILIMFYNQKDLECFLYLEIDKLPRVLYVKERIFGYRRRKTRSQYRNR